MKIKTSPKHYEFDLTFSFQSEQEVAEFYSIFNHSGILSSLTNGHSLGENVRSAIEEHTGNRFDDTELATRAYTNLYRTLKGQS